MKLHYYPETDSLYIELRGEPGIETREVAPGVNVDFNAAGAVVASTSTKPPTNSTSPPWKPSPCRSPRSAPPRTV